MKFDIGTKSFMQNHVYILQPNFIQCRNVKNCSVKVSLFLYEDRILDLRRKTSYHIFVSETKCL